MTTSEKREKKKDRRKNEGTGHERAYKEVAQVPPSATASAAFDAKGGLSRSQSLHSHSEPSRNLAPSRTTDVVRRRMSARALTR
jgi:hypothetical protein